MRKWFVFGLALLLLIPSIANPRTYELKRKAGDYEAEVRIDRYPPVLGDNRIEIEIKDAGGKSITDAKVLVNYYMPPMPRMAPMNYTVVAAGRGRGYETVMDLIMTGPWIIVIRVEARGNVWRVTFPIDVR
jgi:hypothetical protein